MQTINKSTETLMLLLQKFDNQIENKPFQLFDCINLSGRGPATGHHLTPATALRTINVATLLHLDSVVTARANPNWWLGQPPPNFYLFPGPPPAAGPGQTNPVVLAVLSTPGQDKQPEQTVVLQRVDTGQPLTKSEPTLVRAWPGTRPAQPHMTNLCLQVCSAWTPILISTLSSLCNVCGSQCRQNI